MLQLTTSLTSSELTSATFFQTEKTMTVESSDQTSNTPMLSAIFEKEIIEALLKMTNCAGLRIYPGIKNNELVMIAGGVDNENNDMSGLANFCGTGFSEGQAEISSLTESRNIILATGQDEGDLLNSLRTLQTVEGSSRVFKAFFGRSFLENILDTSDQIKFEVAEISFSDNQVHRTIIGKGMNATENHASLLPCPPNCGGGEYITDSDFLA